MGPLFAAEPFDRLPPRVAAVWRGHSIAAIAARGSAVGAHGRQLAASGWNRCRTAAKVDVRSPPDLSGVSRGHPLLRLAVRTAPAVPAWSEAAGAGHWSGHGELAPECRASRVTDAAVRRSRRSRRQFGPGARPHGHLQPVVVALERILGHAARHSNAPSPQ